MSFLALLPALVLAAGAALPETPRRPVTDDYHGTKVTDDYRWLENGSDPEVQRWSDAQNAYARTRLDGLPSRAAITRRVTALLSWESPAYFALEERGGVLFALQQQPPKEQP